MIVPLILCGGSGTRLWPASRASRPKQFLPLFDELSTFQLTLARVAHTGLFARPIVVASRDHRFLAAEQLAAMGVEGDVILEPEPRESGPAVLAGTLHAAARDGPDALVLALAADQLIFEAVAFMRAVRSAAPVARAGRIVTFGVAPDHPATGFGYIERGEPLGTGEAAAVRRFVEKPDAATAAAYVKDGFLWNSGNFLFEAGLLASEYAALESATAAAVADAVRAATPDLGFLLLEPASFARAERRSVDRAVMERSARVAVVPAAFDWSDVGSWRAVHALTGKDGEDNAAHGDALFLNARRNMVSTEGPLVAVVGLDDLVVIATEDAILVARLGDEAGVRAVVERLNAVRPDLARRRNEIFRPWGKSRALDSGPRHQVRRVVIREGQGLSLQRHERRSEHWIVVRGVARVTIGDTETVVREGQSIAIPPDALHRLHNPGPGDLELIEVQTGGSFGDDDIVRPDRPEG